MLKNVSLLRDKKNGRRTWKLLGPTGMPNEPFGSFVNAFARKRSKNTLDVYCRHLAQFFDYLFEASRLIHKLTDRAILTPGVLLDIIEAYDEYLVYGEDSGNEIAQIVARAMPSPRNSRGTSAAKHAPVRAFLKLSDKIHQQTLELVSAGLLQHQSALEPLLDTSRLLVAPSAPQRQALIGNSMLAGVIAGGTKLVPSAILPTVLPHAPFNENRAFPFDRIAEFIAALPAHRDKALYSLYAASGCRGHEGLQVLFDDIDVDQRQVRLVDPATRPNCKSYLYLTPDERYSLSWKGRTTQTTLLIEPFASMFFDELALYLKKEYIPHGLHRFVFQYRHPQRQGRPYFLSDSDSRSELFHKTVRACDVEDTVHGPHSLRHAYGMYLLNYFPRVDGSHGLDIGVVQQMMGHADLKSTQKYARHDQDLIELELRFANAMVFGKGFTKSIVQMKIDSLNSQLVHLETQLQSEQKARLLRK
ncbi:MAG: tyrosine-type recombinase/integrase [Polaromonas sp.]|nr:tyrosine-type recombinase/integrase [Polaromonas sp.]